MPTVTLNGCKHYYDDVGSGDALVLLHGANGSAHQFEEDHPELSKRFRVIAPDMRSMGRSEHVKTMPPSAWVDDLKALLDQLRIQQAHVFGVSLGSRVAMRFGIDHPTRARSVIVTAPHTYLTEEVDRGINQYGDDGTKLPPAEQAERRKRHGDDWLEAHRNYYNIRNVPALQKYYNLRISKPMGQVVGEFSEPVTKIKCPILVIQSDNISMGRSVFDHAIELKNELPSQVKLAIVPSYDARPRGIPSAMLRMIMVDFIDHLTPVPAGR